MTRSADRIAELESKIARLTAAMQNHEAEMVPSLTARIAELEAECGTLQAQRDMAIIDGQVRIAELEAERDRLKTALAALLSYETERDHLFLSADIARARAALSTEQDKT